MKAIEKRHEATDDQPSPSVAAMRGQDPPWLDELTSALGWQGGTAAEAINAVKRLVDAAEEFVGQEQLGTVDREPGMEG